MKRLLTLMAAVSMTAACDPPKCGGSGDMAEIMAPKFVAKRLKGEESFEVTQIMANDLPGVCRYEVIGTGTAANSFGARGKLSFYVDISYSEERGTWRAQEVQVFE